MKRRKKKRKRSIESKAEQSAFFSKQELMDEEDY